jgi:hypothetical protein
MGMPRGTGRLFLATLLVMAGACRESTVVESDVLSVRRHRANIELHNRSSRTVYTFAVDQNILPLIEWVPCADPATCNGIEPGETRITPLTTFLGQDRKTSAIEVFYWHLVPAPASSTGFQPDEIRSLVIEID